MEAIFKQFLQEKHCLVHNPGLSTDQADDVVLALMTLFAVRINSGYELADKDMIDDCAALFGTRVPLPFYRGFPQTVRALSPDQLLFDQLVHYTVTYGFGKFDEAGHSIFESYLERVALKKEVKIRDFTIVDEKEGMEIVKAAIIDMLASSRPLNDASYKLVKAYVVKYGMPCESASKNTAIRLFVETGKLAFASGLFLSDVIKVTEYLNYTVYGEDTIKSLNLKNQDRKKIISLLDHIFENGVCNIRECYEKKALWCGLLHHIHYKPKCEKARAFVKAMRSKSNESVFSAFEKAMLQGEVEKAAELLKKGKGDGALWRNLHYLLSRCKNEAEIEALLSMLGGENVMILLQLYIRYCTYHDEGLRTFRFARFNRMVVYRESEKEARRRKTVLSKECIKLLKLFCENKLMAALKNRVGKVYLDEAMKKIALPIQESTTMGGFGVLPRGSRLPMAEGEKLRAFVYWEKVSDIDLSAIGIDENGNQQEFSWRTMAGCQSAAITFSGDETSGYYGGSEFFDIDLEAFRRIHPTLKYLIFTANVYSEMPFCESICRAGYMMRDIEESGEIYEPKTVKSAYTVNCNSTEAYLFGLDLDAGEFVWLNIARDSDNIVAGREAFDHLVPYFGVSEAMNYYDFFKLMAEEVVDDPMAADIVVSDAELTVREDATVIRSYEYEKLFKFMN